MSLPSVGMRAFGRFALVGTLFATANVLLLALMVSQLGWHYIAACSISFFALNFLSYLVNKTFTFRLSKQVVPQEVARYYIVMAGSLAANLFLMYTLVDLMDLHYLLACLAVTGILSSVNFLGHAAFSFRQSCSPQSSNQYDILQISAFFPEHGGGIEAVAGRLATEWDSMGLRVAWCAGQRPGAPSSSAGSGSRFPARYWDFLEKRIGLPLPIWHPSETIAMWRLMRQSRIVQLHDFLYTPCMLAMLFARIQRKPVVLTQHIGELPIRNWLAGKVIGFANKTIGKTMLSLADQVVFIASPVQAYFSSFVRFAIAPKLIANGVDHEIFHPDLTATSKDDVVQLLFVGRFVEKKGIHLLRSSLHLPRVRWTFAGWGPLNPAQWADIPSSVRLAGHVDSSLLAPLYQQADLLVLPSVGEGFPLVVQEALACGTPVLVSQDVAKACLGRDPRCVFDVDVSEPGAACRIEKRIRDLASNPSNLRQARVAAVAMAQQWSWRECAESYRNIYAKFSISSKSSFG